MRRSSLEPQSWWYWNDPWMPSYSALLSPHYHVLDEVHIHPATFIIYIYNELDGIHPATFIFDFEDPVIEVRRFLCRHLGFSCICEMKCGDRLLRDGQWIGSYGFKSNPFLTINNCGRETFSPPPGLEFTWWPPEESV